MGRDHPAPIECIAQLNDHLSQLAHHFSHSEDVDKAIEYLGRAGQQAVQRSAHTDAVRNLTAAIVPTG
jgi:predicted ATPase